MDSNVKLDVDVVAVNRADLLPPSSISPEPKVSGVATKASNELSMPMFVSLALVIVLLFGITAKIMRIRLLSK